MLAGFETPSQGQIVMDGRPVTGASRDRAVVFQGDDSLYGWLTAIENVEFGLRMRHVPKTERRDEPCDISSWSGFMARSESIRLSCPGA